MSKPAAKHIERKPQHGLAFGIVLTLLGGSLWGVSGTSVQYLTSQVNIDPALITMIRVLFAGIIYLPFLVTEYRHILAKIFSQLPKICLVALLGIVLFSNQLFYAQTVRATNAGTATVLQMLACVFVLFFVCIKNKRLPYMREIIGILLAVLATMLIATQGDLSSLNIPIDGLFWGLLAALASAGYIVIPKQFHLFDDFGPVPVVGLAMTLSNVIAIPTYLIQGGSFEAVAILFESLSLFNWMIVIVCLVILGTILGFILYLYGTSLVGPVKGSLLGAIEPASATVMSAIFLGTFFSIYDILGMIVMCVMVFFISGKEKPNPSELDQD